MRVAWLPFVFLLALPAFADGDTRSIQLEFLSPGEVLQFLTSSSDAGRGDGFGERNDPERVLLGLRGAAAPLEGVNPLPAGITALAADSQGRCLNVSGTPEGIEQLKRIVRLLDLPRRRLRLSMRVFEPDPKSLQGVGLARPDPDAASLVTKLPGKQADVLWTRAQTQYVLAQVDGTDAHVARFFVPAEATGVRRIAAVLPRVNGDGTITLLAGIHENSETRQATCSALRRVASGDWVLILMPVGQPSWLIRAELLSTAHQER